MIKERGRFRYGGNLGTADVDMNDEEEMFEELILECASSSSGDVSMAEHRILGSVLSKADEETKKKRMAEEDMHTITNTSP